MPRKHIIALAGLSLLLSGCGSSGSKDPVQSTAAPSPQEMIGETLTAKFSYNDFTMYFDPSWVKSDTDDGSLRLNKVEDGKTVAVVIVNNSGSVVSDRDIAKEKSSNDTEDVTVKGDRGLSFIAHLENDDHTQKIEVGFIPTNTDTYAIMTAADDSSEYTALEYLTAILEKTEIDPSYKPTPPPQPKMTYEITDIYENIYDYTYVGKMYEVIIEVKNTGEVPLYLDKCTLDYEDNDGHLLQTTSPYSINTVPAVIQPGEKGYFYTAPAKFDEGVSFENGCNLAYDVTLVKADEPLKLYEVTDTTVYSSMFGGVGIKGRVINDTDQDVSSLNVKTVFFNAEGRPIGVSGTSVYDVGANSKTSFDDSGLLNTFSINDVADHRTYAYEMYWQY